MTRPDASPVPLEGAASGRVSRDEETVAALRKARELIVKGWTQDAWGRDAAGHPLNLADLAERGARFCVSGALRVAAPGSLRATEIFRDAIGYPRGGVVLWNDREGRTKEDVLAALDCAILIVTGSAR